MATICIGDAPELEAYLAQRIYEHNAAATGYHDAEFFSAAHKTESGAILAGISGYTWGGCCFISYLWVEERSRRHGLGSGLLSAVESHARRKQCRLILVSSHSFRRLSSTLGGATSRWRGSTTIPSVMPTCSMPNSSMRADVVAQLRMSGQAFPSGTYGRRAGL